MFIQVMPSVRMCLTVTTRLIEARIDDSERSSSERIRRLTPFPGQASFSASGTEPVKPPLAGPPSARKLENRTTPPSRNSQ